MSDTPEMVALDEADIASLRHHATVMMGLEIKSGTNGSQIRSAIKKADAGIEQIPVYVPEGPGVPRSAPPAGSAIAGAIRTAVATAVATADGQPVVQSHVASTNADPMHHCHDPRITIRVFKTDDRRRTKDVTVQVNGVTFRMQREVDVEVPYRVYLALKDALEDAAVDGDEVNPVTGDPIKVWVMVPSYPHQVVKVPSPDEVEAWTERTSRSFQNVPA
jgi:hypothetical protein